MEQNNNKTLRTAIASMLLFISCFGGVIERLSALETATNHQRCDPIGRILSGGDRRLAAGSLLCKGDRLQVAKGATVEVLCYLNRKILRLKSGMISDSPHKCVPQSTQFQPCTPDNRNNCPNPKGPGEVNNAPALISPYSSSILNARPNLSWSAVAGATSYTLQVNGVGVNWEKNVKNTYLPYPKEQPELQLGNAYQITVIADRNESPIGASVSVVNLLRQSDAKQILEVVKRINNLGLPRDEAAFLDLNAVYMSKNLLYETIDTLKSRVRAGSQNPTLYRVLGDRYLEAGLPDEAEREYKTATMLAKRVGNSTELAKAQAGLQRIQLSLKS